MTGCVCLVCDIISGPCPHCVCACSHPSVELRKHPLGSIKKISMRNFMTHAFTEIEPAPGINFLIGPNGSGKSTVVCALCLGLGGKTDSLARGGAAKDYIRTTVEPGGSAPDCATITIVLSGVGDGGADMTIARRIKMDSTSEWRMKGQPSNEKAVKEFVKTLAIDVDSRCQFLAQDMVATFSKMKPHEWLKATEQAIGDGSLWDAHLELIELRRKNTTAGKVLGEVCVSRWCRISTHFVIMSVTGADRQVELAARFEVAANRR